MGRGGVVRAQVEVTAAGKGRSVSCLLPSCRRRRGSPPLPAAVSLPVNSLCGCPAIESIAAAAPNEFRSSSLGNGAADPKLWALIHLSSV